MDVILVTLLFKLSEVALKTWDNDFKLTEKVYDSKDHSPIVRRNRK